MLSWAQQNQLINSTNYSKSHFRRLFKNKYGISIHKYLIEVRLNKARSLLKNSNINCTNIASICGFSDNFSFSKLFKIKYGISPKQFQLQSRQNQ